MRNSSHKPRALRRAGASQILCMLSNGRAMKVCFLPTMENCSLKITAHCGVSKQSCGAGVMRVRQYYQPIRRHSIASRSGVVSILLKHFAMRSLATAKASARDTTNSLGLEISSLPRCFVQKSRRGTADIQRINFGGHWNRDQFIASLQNRRADTVSLTAENDTAVLREIRLIKRRTFCTRVRGDGANPR